MPSLARIEVPPWALDVAMERITSRIRAATSRISATLPLPMIAEPEIPGKMLELIAEGFNHGLAGALE